tara:strand:- start:420 stop:890 length:471 start_codon:yes stop_codon:yes gene_type:complete
MQNKIKSKTRLAFVQYIFQSEFLNIEKSESIEDFQQHFYNSNIAIMSEDREFRLKFNKNFLNKLFNNYKNNLNKKSLVDELNNFINIERKFEKWDKTLKALIFAILSELNITDKKKINIVFDDYLNISKSLLSSKETKLFNAIVQKYIDNHEISKK